MRPSRAPPAKDKTSIPQKPSQSSRIPTKASSNYANNKPASNDLKAKATTSAPQHVSRTGKRTSRSITQNSTETAGTSHPPTVATAAPSALVASRQASTASFAQLARAEDLSSASARHNSVLLAPRAVQTPSLRSATSVSATDSPRSRSLRRKPSTIEQYKRGDSPKVDEHNNTLAKTVDAIEEELQDSIRGIALPRTEHSHHATVSGTNIPSDALSQSYALSRDNTPPVSNHPQSATPSTRYTDSPFSHVPTPSSASSYSPAVVTTNPSADHRQRQPSPTRSRPPLSGRFSEKSHTNHLGLPLVRESSTSSSNSTVKPSETRSAQLKKVSPPKSASAPSTRTKPAETAAGAKAIKEQYKQALPATQRTTTQIPPELAHLNVDPPQKSSTTKSTPPLRPSRDGTPTLTGVNIPSPVVQSDLPRLYTTYHKRTPSQETQTTPASPNIKTRFGFSSKTSSRQPSPRIDSAISPPPTARSFTRGPSTDTTIPEAPRVARKDSPAVAPSPSKSSRFGLFSRKPKADSSKPPEKPTRPPSKGPTAGTGHEGYGRFSMQRRSSSTSSGAGHRSPSTESNASSLYKRQSTSRKSSAASKDGQELDAFLRDRLSPVILRGSGSTVSNPASSLDGQVPSGPNSSHNSSLDGVHPPSLLPSAMDSAAGRSPAKRPVQNRRAPSDSSEDDVAMRYPAENALTVAATGNSGYQSGSRHLAANVGHHPQKKSSLGSQNAIDSAQDLSEGKEGLWLRSGKAPGERKTPRKWNFFQRAQASPRDKEKGRTIPNSENINGLGRQASTRNIAHYAMMDLIESVDLEEVDRIVQENETSPEESNSESYVQTRARAEKHRAESLPRPPALTGRIEDSQPYTRPVPPGIMVRQQSNDSSHLMYADTTIPHQAPHVVDIRRSPISATVDPEAEQKAMMTSLRPLLPQPREELRTPDVPQGPADTPESLEIMGSPRQPRLSPVGRIPKVVSRRDRERKLSNSSFSRPFVRGQPKPIVKPPGSLYNQIRELASPTDSNSQPVSSTSTNSNALSGDRKNAGETNARQGSVDRARTNAFDRGDFFSFLPRRTSDVSYSSSSGNNSILAYMAAQPPQEDDIWHEYNDLLDEVMPGKLDYSVAPSLEAPFQYPTALYDSAEFASQNWQPPSIDLPAPPRSYTVPQHISRLIGQGLNGTSSAQQSGMSKTLPFRSTGTRGLESSRSSLPRSTQNRSSLARSSHSSALSARGSAASSVRNSRGSVHSRSASLPEANPRNSRSSLTPSARLNRDTQLLGIAEIEGDEQAAAASLRFGALMSSKWLSFGRVLFSPAHYETMTAGATRLLVIDGLGSDWSYYVAMSYPKATVYNLGPPPANGVSDWPGINEKCPSNHRHINHAAISAAFPFPKGFFTAVVFRFPLATTEQAYQACIFECKRVLQPGGFLEVAALDVDLMNMGNKARKELRGLKTQLQLHRRDVSLRNLTDMLVHLIGRRGFEDIQRCIVAVPAAGRIPKSLDMSSLSSGTSGRPVWQREDRQSQDFSFDDLLEDAHADQSGQRKHNDESLTKMMAKVGRWWYSTCYEKSVLRTDSSIWNDAALLRECEKQGTSFRLLLCCAQKPAQARRRTVSV